ncbi:MAG: hypothetical protein KF813_06325 [Trueperaceae bacterium]|nr:hypothetical protein [Trueperaceae bacterium]
MPGPLYLGVDLGTSQLKVGVLDAEGVLHAEGRAAYGLTSPRPGWAEQDAETWWLAFVDALAQAGRQVDLQRVEALCVVAQSPTIVPVGPDGHPAGPAITWADRRATAEATWLGEQLGTNVRVEFEALPRILWLKSHEPDLYARTTWFMLAYDYLPFRLTGRPVSIFPHERLRQWTPERLDAAGLDRNWFAAESMPPATVVGTITPACAAQLGLRTDCLVVSGTVDAFAHWVGTDMTQPGRLCNIGGTSEGVSLFWSELLSDPRYRVFGIPSPFGSGWMIGGSMSNGGSVLDWATRTFHGGSDRDVVLAAVARIGPGADGIIALPYLLGERTPIYDSDARGVMVGLSPHHGPAHLTRALLEGVAFGLRSVIEVLESLGASVEEVVATGGTARSSTWNQIKASVTGKRVKVPIVRDSGVTGAAILACSAASGQPLTTASAAMVRFETIVTPDERESATYDAMYPHFLDLYQQLKGPLWKLADLRREREDSTSDRKV